MRFAVDEQITFDEEPDTPYTIQAIDSRYAILTRPMTQNDADNEDWEGNIEGNVMYSIVDSHTWTRSKNDLIFNCYEYKTRSGCEQCLADLAAGKIALSKRREIQVVIT
jgi:hypothetical protein